MTDTNSARDALLARNSELAQVIRPLHTAEYETDIFMHRFERALEELANDYGGIDLCPDFQRGHVWTPQQQRHFVENILRGVVTTAGMLLQFNCPNWTNVNYAGDLPRGFQCIDGLQRLTAVSAFLRGEVRPFGLTLADLEGSSYSPNNFRFRIAIHNFEQRTQVLQHYLDINSGGTAHQPEELERVRGLLAEATQNNEIQDLHSDLHTPG